MPFVRPTLTELVARITSDFETRIDGADTLLRRSVLKVMAKVHAGAVHLLYGFLGYQADQLFVSTSDTDGLDVIADEYGISRKAATAATGTTQATGTNGTAIPAGTELQSSDGSVYTVDTGVTIAGGIVDLDITASVARADGNEDAAVTLTFISPITGVDTTTTVDSDGLTGGSDEEEDDDLRGRVLTRKRRPPHGGAEADYEAWALEVSGVTRAWAIPQYNGAGTIGVAFVRDDDTSIIPNSTQRDAMRAYIVEHEDPASGETVGIPVTAEPGLFIIELTELAINFTINIYPNTSAVRATVQSELEDLILRDGGPEQTIYLSNIIEAISGAVGEERHSLTSPAADITAAVNQVHILGTITWSDY